MKFLGKAQWAVVFGLVLLGILVLSFVVSTYGAPIRRYTVWLAIPAFILLGYGLYANWKNDPSDSNSNF